MALFSRNLPNAAIFPARLWISFTVLGFVVFNMASTFFGFTLIPVGVTIYPKNFPSSALNIHFLGFNFIPSSLGVICVLGCHV